MATKDRTSLKNEFKNGNLATGERFADLIDSVKVVQLPVVDPQVLGSTSSFIDSISQDADGKITATKKNVVLNYVNIQDKPQINGHTLNGDMSLKELGIINQIHLNDGTAIYPDQDGNVKLPVIPQTTNTITPGSAFVPTADAVDEALEEQNLLVPKANPYTAAQKYNASANINDRGADIAPITGVVNSLGYKVLNPNASFVSQVVDANTVYEIRDYFDLSGTEQELTVVTIPANCKLRFEGGMLGGEFCILQGNNTLIESDSVCIQKGVKIAGTWGNDTIYTKWLEFVSVKDAYLPAAAGTEGVMHPVFEDGIYYKSGINWLLLISEPDDWETNYSDYYELLNNEYTPVTEVAPPYTKNTYYELYDDGTYHLITTDTAPDDWETNYMDYYVNNSGTHVSGVAPEFKTNTYYKNNGIGYEKLIEKPDDWVANWDEYFVKDGNNYITPMGVIDNPNATNNILQFKQLQNLINGSKNCKVEFEKGIYQSNIIDTIPNGNGYNNYQPTTVKDGVTYEVWSTNIYKPDKWIILNILNTSVEINLNGSTLIGLRNTCPSWNFINYAGDGYCYIHDGEVIGFADHFDYPNYVNWNDKIIANYEFAAQIRLGGGAQKVENIISKYTTSDGIYAGSGGFYYRGGELPYPTELSGLVKYPCTSYEIKNCEVCYCARNGFGLLSCHAGTLKNNHIHHIGSTGASGTIGSDGIKGQSPQAGIDVEFEDGQGLRPIMQWDGLKIHDCQEKAFGFATVRLSLMQSFIATNLVIEGDIRPNNIKTVDGLPIFKGCSFTLAYGNGSMLGKAVYENCSFDIQKPLMMGNNEYYNCTFVDNCTLQQTILFIQNKAKALYNNCHLLLKHACHLSYGSFTDCAFEFGTINQQVYSVYIGDCTFLNCSFKSLFTVQHQEGSLQVNRNIRFTRLNIGEFCKFINCSFDNILGVGGSEDGKSFYDVDFTFENCKGNINVCSGNNNLAIVNCEGQNILVSGYNSGEGKNINITGCNYKSWYIINIPRENIVVKDSIVVFPSTGQCRSYCTFINCDITYSQKVQGYFTLIDGNKIFDSVVTFSGSIANSLSENRITLTNSYIKGAATQVAFKGVVTDCTFENNANSGTSTQRPAYNLVIGQKYYDTTLGKPIFWNGNAWIDANGDYIVDNSGTLQNRLALTSSVRGQQFKLTGGENDVYLIYGDYGWLNATDRSPWYDDRGTLNAMYDK